MRTYAGIGSRETPTETLQAFRYLGAVLGREGWTLRSGGAPGADSAFEAGAVSVRGRCEIYLPWRGFLGHPSPLCGEPTPEMYALAKKYHPAWDRCSDAAKRLHARNGCQILGIRLDDPVDVVVCWTRGGRLVGGTAQALRIALDRKIPIVNAGSRPFDYVDLHDAVTALAPSDGR